MIAGTSIRGRRFVRRVHLSAGTLNLVSLMDIFTILVFYLLVSSSGVEVLPNPKSLQLPQSASDEPARETLVLMVTEQDVLVGGRLVMAVDQAQSTAGAILPNLKYALQEQATLLPIAGQPGQMTRGEVNIMADKDLPFALLKKVMATCAEARFARISLSVIRKYPGPPASS